MSMSWMLSFQLTAVPFCADVVTAAREEFKGLEYFGSTSYPDWGFGKPASTVHRWGDDGPTVALMFRDTDPIGLVSASNRVGECVTEELAIAQWILVKKSDFK